MIPLIEDNKEAIVTLCEPHGVERLAVFHQEPGVPPGIGAQR